MSSSAQSDAPAASTILFARGVLARLSLWSTLRIAVQESWGGPGASEKRTWLASEIVDSFEQSPLPDDQYIEELLLQVMSDEFEVVVEDGSAEAVAKDIMKLWQETREGKEEGVRNFEELARKIGGKKLEVKEEVRNEDEWSDEDEEGGSGDEEGEEEAPQLIAPKAKEEPVVDEDGFTLVQGKGKGKK
ncbi:Pre-rRNA-processing protein TSR2-domain-containing protein [Crucibulum laeve]|uniref:Pre-rRNA-processing protein TSR2-domain-containing protein n=1 Tax=Crucibulum laeve TaxID=68775 RepID=A0A5C3M9S0_9AGAR|nr:Pre-rRNA-processing protein TSR2-domain-containing protein [Crucibulum laeve]